jgi:dihydrofolate synthase/folylpolyglutamate synthase
MTPRERLFALEQFGIKLGLDNITAIVNALDRPDRAWMSVHVGGTNGKGSVTAMVERGLRAAGYRTGRYTSPHLSDVEERIAIDGRPIGPALFDEAAARTFEAVDAARRSGTLRVDPTFFEVTTALAFDVFRREQAAIAVVEVGLGGRFDATNVVTPTASVITSIAKDHERHLGSTIPEIAFEKAGIVKPGVPLIVGELPEDARRVIGEIARDRDAPLVEARAGDLVTALTLDRGCPRVSIKTAHDTYPSVTLGLNGEHQVQNAVVAVRTLETCRERGVDVGRAHVLAALEDVDWPARLEWLDVGHGRHVLLDAAHNPAGAGALAQYLASAGAGPMPLVMAVMRDKDLAGMLDALSPVASHIVATATTSARSLTAAELGAQIAIHRRGVANTVVEHMDEAIEAAFAYGGRIVVTGSLFLVGPARASLMARGAVPIRGTGW